MITNKGKVAANIIKDAPRTKESGFIQDFVLVTLRTLLSDIVTRLIVSMATKLWQFAVKSKEKLSSSFAASKKENQHEHKMFLYPSFKKMEGLLKARLKGNKISKLSITGGPGMGKTLFANYLSSTLNLPIHTFKPFNAAKQREIGTIEVAHEFLSSISKTPCVLLLDEVDSFCPFKGASNSSSIDPSFSYLLDWSETQRAPVIIILTSNRKEQIDSIIDTYDCFKINIEQSDVQENMENIIDFCLQKSKVALSSEARKSLSSLCANKPPSFIAQFFNLLEMKKVNSKPFTYQEVVDAFKITSSMNYTVQ